MFRFVPRNTAPVFILALLFLSLWASALSAETWRGLTVQASCPAAHTTQVRLPKHGGTVTPGENLAPLPSPPPTEGGGDLLMAIRWASHGREECKLTRHQQIYVSRWETGGLRMRSGMSSRARSRSRARAVS